MANRSPEEQARYEQALRSSIMAEEMAKRGIRLPENISPAQAPELRQPSGHPNQTTSDFPSATPDLTVTARPVEAQPKRQTSRSGRVFMVGVVVVGVTALVASGKVNAQDIKNFVGHGQESSASNTNDSKSSITHTIPEVGTDGFNLKNCQLAGAAIVSIVFNGDLPLIYDLKSPDGSTITPGPYLQKNMVDPGIATNSGYPELQIRQQPLEIDACAKDGETVTTEDTTSITIDLSKLDFIVKPINPTDHATWPTKARIIKNPDGYTDASVDAVNTAHKDPKQQIGAVNVSIKALVDQASIASPDSVFNKTAVFKDGENTLSAEIRTGLAERVTATKTVNFNGNIGSLVPQVGNEQPTLLSFDQDPNIRFRLGQTSVMLGSYDNLSNPQATPSASPTETN